MTDQTSQLATLDAETLARELDWATAANGIATLRAHGESAAADALALLAAHCEAWSRTAERRQVMLNAANAMNGVHQRTITRLREQLAQAQSAPGPAGLTRVWSGYDDDECWFPMFADLADAKAYAEAAYRAQCAAYGTNAPEQVAWTERTAYTEDKGFPGMFDLETGTGWVVCELLVHPSLASGLAAQPIETGDEQAVPDPQVEGQTVIALVPGRQDTAAETRTCTGCDGTGERRDFNADGEFESVERCGGCDGTGRVAIEDESCDEDAPTCRDCGTWPCARHATEADRAEYEQATESGAAR